MPVGILIALMGCLAVVSVYFWLVRKPTEPNPQ